MPYAFNLLQRLRAAAAVLLLLAGAGVGAARAVTDADLLDPEKAFRFSAQALDASTLEVRYQIAPGYYLYRDKFRFDAGAVKLGPAVLPPGKKKRDEFFGDVETYRGDLRIRVPLAAGGGAPQRLTLTVTSQGCADAGVCYPPQESRAEIVLAAASVVPGTPSPFTLAPAQTAPPPAVAPPPAQSEESLIADLFRGGLWMAVTGFFAAGLLLAFTPCVFPMIPILSGILVPHGEHLTHARGFALSLAYVLGMAITYAAAGVAAGLAGTLLAAALQNAWVLGAFAAIFVALAASMFGLYELQLPSSWQTRVAQTSNKLHGGHFAGVFAMGVLSALLVGPCMAAPLAGALLYIGKTQDVVLGGSALFAMALGMGVPLLVVGASAGALLPKAGPWMDAVKRCFGFVLLGLALYFVSSLLPAPLVLGLWAALFIGAAIFLRAIDPLPPHAPGWRRFGKALGVVALVVGAALLVGALSGGRDVFQPLAGLRTGAREAEPGAVFRRVASAAELDAALAQARAAGRPVMLDFYADWCVSCKEMERYTFTDPAVQARLARVTLLQADVTANTDADKALLKRYSLYGPPGIIFFDREGREVRGLRVIGYQDAARFTRTLDLVLPGSGS
jgi:thiol:disulfide interchange protein DsbD